MALPQDSQPNLANEVIAVAGDNADSKKSSPLSSDIASSASFEQLIEVNIAEEMAPNQLNALAPISLAYIGDAVFELYVRSRLLIPSKRIRDYHQQVVGQVKAEQQARYVDVLLPHLNTAEQDILRRGRNATTGRSRRAKGADYQKATGLEALVGFLYLSDTDRLISLLNRLEIS